MSYILDALRKSEQQRPPGPVPDLFTLHGPQPPVPRRSLRAVAAVSLLLFAAAVGLRIWLGADRHDDGAGPARVEAPTTPDVAAPAATRSVGADAPPPKVPAALRGPAETRRPATPKPPAPAANSPAAPEPPAVSAAPAIPAAAPAAAVESPLAVLPAPVTPAATPVLAEAPPPEEAPPSDGRVFTTADLPAAVRAQLPELVVSGHVWSDDPGLRLMTVNDRLLREGAEAASGVRLQEITSNGAVFVFKGWRFRAGAVRP